jgi:ArsR family metal-binding transcriptional regulator
MIRKRETDSPKAMKGRWKFSIAEYSPLLICLGDPTKFRVVARLNPPPGDILTRMDHLFEKSTFSKKMDALFIKRESTIITLFASGIVTMTRLNSDDHGRQILHDVVDKMNEAFSNGNSDSVRQVPEVRRRIDPMEINRALPHSNCGKCGFKSCFFFATMLAFSEAGLERCVPLFEERYTANRQAVAKMISSG